MSIIKAKRDIFAESREAPGDRERRIGRCIYPDCRAPSMGAPTGVCLKHGIAVALFMQRLLQEMAQPLPPKTKPEDAVGLVYFIRLGDRVKIGFTRNLAQRMANLPHEEILAIVPGTMKDERRCHAAFAHLRMTGEWFRAEPDILEFAAAVDRRGGLDEERANA